MRVAFLFGVLIGAASAGAAEVKGTKVEGRVINSITSEPIRKATVSLLPSGARGGRGGGPGMGGPGGGAGYDAVTDAGGAFKIEGVPDGEYRISAERTGFVRTGGGSSGPVMLRLAARGDNDSQSVTIKLAPQGVLAGRVLDEDGDPMEHAQVQLLRRMVSGGKRQINVMSGASTNDLGEFRLSAVSPGRYWLVAMRGGGGGPGFGFARGPGRAPVRRTSAERSYIPVYYPDAEDPARASEISVAPGQQVQGIEMRLRKGNTYHVRGKVQGMVPGEANERFSGPPGAMVFLMPADNNGWSPDRRPAPVSFKDGLFDVGGVRPGRYVLTANQMRRDSRRSARTLVDVSEADVEGLDLTLQESPALKGKVVIEGEGELTEMSLTLLETSGSQFGGSFGRVKKEDGTFTMSPSDPGQYRVMLGGIPAGLYLKSIHYGEREVKLDGFDVSAGGGELKLTLASGAPVVRGVVKDSKGDPAGNVTVSVAPQDGLVSVWDLYRTAKTDQQGAFEFSLQPGSFKFYAWEQIDPGDHQDPVLLEKYSTKAASEKLASGDQKNIELKLISPQ